jgi:hypothetical protein
MKPKRRAELPSIVVPGSIQFTDRGVAKTRREPTRDEIKGDTQLRKSHPSWYSVRRHTQQDKSKKRARAKEPTNGNRGEAGRVGRNWARVGQCWQKRGLVEVASQLCVPESVERDVGEDGKRGVGGSCLPDVFFLCWRRDVVVGKLTSRVGPIGFWPLCFRFA